MIKYLFGQIKKLEANTFTIVVNLYYEAVLVKILKGKFKRPLALDNWGCFGVKEGVCGIPELIGFWPEDLQICDMCGKTSGQDEEWVS